MEADRRTRYLERLANLDQDELLAEFAHAAPRRKSAPLAFLLHPGHPSREALLRCGTPKKAYDRAGRRIPGNHRCKLPICGNCQTRASKKASRRVHALVAAATLGSPEHETVSFVTVNCPDHDLVRFKKTLAKALKETKWVAQFQIGLAGTLHAHVVVIHENFSRTNLKSRVEHEFRQARAVNAKAITQEWLLDGVVSVTRYSMNPVKARDFRRDQSITVGMVEDWVRIQNQITGVRKMAAGFTRSERNIARDLLRKEKGCDQRNRENAAARLMNVKLEQVNAQVQGELGFQFGVKCDQNAAARLMNVKLEQVNAQVQGELGFQFGVKCDQSWNVELDKETCSNTGCGNMIMTETYDVTIGDNTNRENIPIQLYELVGPECQRETSNRAPENGASSSGLVRDGGATCNRSSMRFTKLRPTRHLSATEQRRGAPARRIAIAGSCFSLGILGRPRRWPFARTRASPARCRRESIVSSGAEAPENLAHQEQCSSQAHLTRRAECIMVVRAQRLDRIAMREPFIYLEAPA